MTTRTDQARASGIDANDRSVRSTSLDAGEPTVLLHGLGCRPQECTEAPAVLGQDCTQFADSTVAADERTASVTDFRTAHHPR